DYQVGPFSKENIFGVMRKYDPAFGLGGDAFAIMNVGRNNVGGWGGNTPTRDLADSFDPVDPRKMFTIISHNDVFKTSTGGEEVHTNEDTFMILIYSKVERHLYPNSLDKTTIFSDQIGSLIELGIRKYC